MPRRRTQEPDLWIAVGIDPGAKGAVAWLDSHGNYDAVGLDTKDLSALRAAFEPILTAWEAGYEVVVGLEDVHGRGGWGAKQTFSFGGSWWVPNAFLLDEGYEQVPIKPTRWQTQILGPGVRAPRAKLERKELWVEAASDKWPDLDYTSGEADAMWIAFAAAVGRGWAAGVAA